MRRGLLLPLLACALGAQGCVTSAAHDWAAGVEPRHVQLRLEGLSLASGPRGLAPRLRVRLEDGGERLLAPDDASVFREVPGTLPAPPGPLILVPDTGDVPRSLAPGDPIWRAGPDGTLGALDQATEADLDAWTVVLGGPAGSLDTRDGSLYLAVLEPHRDRGRTSPPFLLDAEVTRVVAACVQLREGRHVFELLVARRDGSQAVLWSRDLEALRDGGSRQGPLPAGDVPVLAVESLEGLDGDALARRAGTDGVLAEEGAPLTDDERRAPPAVVELTPQEGGRLRVRFHVPPARRLADHREWARVDPLDRTRPAQVGAWALFGLALPFTVALDVATAPVQGAVLLAGLLVGRPPS